MTTSQTTQSHYYPPARMTNAPHVGTFSGSTHLQGSTPSRRPARGHARRSERGGNEPNAESPAPTHESTSPLPPPALSPHHCGARGGGTTRRGYRVRPRCRGARCRALAAAHWPLLLP